ncbi:MAG: LytTR family DNA-binding domain-containing protein [Desulfosarcinaceae bacterium]
MQKAVSALIADDEPALRIHLKSQLQQTWPDLSIASEAANGVEALEQILTLKPDIAFLDIKMPGMTGMEVAHQAAHLCHIVFITAYDHFAVEAFENEAVDYLLKPVEPQRLASTVQRLKARLDRQVLDPDPIHSALKSLQERMGEARPVSYLKWIKVMDKQTIRLVAVEEICFFQAQDKYTVVQTQEEEFLIRKPIKVLVEELDPEMFWQIHRATIVNAAFIDKVSTSLTGSYVLSLKNRPGTFTVSRSYRERFRSM